VDNKPLVTLKAWTVPPTGPIDAVGDGQVTLSTPFDSGWSANGVPFSCAGAHAGAVVYRLSDGPDRGKYVYVSEGITPTVSDGQSVKAGQQIATFTGCIEIGWGSPTSDQRTLAGVTDPGAAHPPPGTGTVWGESFKRFFGIP